MQQRSRKANTTLLALPAESDSQSRDTRQPLSCPFSSKFIKQRMKSPFCSSQEGLQGWIRLEFQFISDSNIILALSESQTICTGEFYQFYLYQRELHRKYVPIYAQITVLGRMFNLVCINCMFYHSSRPVFSTASLGPVVRFRAQILALTRALQLISTMHET